VTGTTQRAGCLGPLELDRLLAGDDDPALRRRAEACTHCRIRIAELVAQRDAHLTPAHVSAQAAAIRARLAAVAPAPERSRGRAWWLAPPALVMAAAITVLALWPRHPELAAPQTPRDEIRIKGGARFEVVRAEPGAPQVIGDGEPLPAGATLSFRVACPGGCWAALFAVSDGSVAVLADERPPPWNIAGGASVQLPVSVTRDRAPERAQGGARSDDRVIAVLCVRLPDVAALRAALAQRPGAAPPAIAGCEVRTQRIARPGPAP